MKYRRDYQETHDIDWFFIYKGQAHHAASNGGKLPDVVDSRVNRELQVKIEALPRIAQPSLTMDDNEEDLKTFEEYAAKGLISLDRVDGITYRKVAFPSQGESFAHIELRRMMPVLGENDIDIL